MQNNNFLFGLFSRSYRILTVAISRVQPFTLFVSCLGIWLAYLTGVYATGSFHTSSRWMGAMLSCTSVITVLQMPTYRDSLKLGVMRVIGTFLGTLIAYIYLKMLPFSVVGMLLTVFALEALCMMLNIYNNGRIATITLLIIMLVSQLSPKSDPMVNCSLRFFESAVGVGVGLAVRWSIEWWGNLRRRLMFKGEDGKSVDMDSMPLRWGHLRVVAVASMGQLAGGALSTLVGVVLPLVQVLSNMHLSPSLQGLVASMSLVGIMVGSVIIGESSDKHGYLRYLRLSPAIILVGAVVALFARSVGVLMLALFAMGFGVGGNYSLDSNYISEMMPRRWRLFMVGVAKASSAIGNVAMAFICYFILREWNANSHWSGLFLLVVLMALVMLFAAVRFAESPAWLLSRGRKAEAEQAVKYFLGDDVVIGDMAAPQPRARGGLNLLQGKGLMRVILSGVPWACEGFAVYGVGVFLPVLIMALGLSHGHGGITHIVSSVHLSAYINIFVVVGFVMGLVTLKRIRHTRQQIWGFWGSALALVLLMVGYKYHIAAWMMVIAFLLFEIMLNAGPHLITFILPPQIYPIAERGAGTGIAAAFGKAGAVAGVLFMPILMKWGGVELALGVTAALLLLGAVITQIFAAKVLPKEQAEWRYDK